MRYVVTVTDIDIDTIVIRFLREVRCFGSMHFTLRVESIAA